MNADPRRATVPIEWGQLGEGLSRKGWIITVELTDIEAEALLSPWWQRRWRFARQRVRTKVTRELNRIEHQSTTPGGTHPEWNPT